MKLICLILLIIIMLGHSAKILAQKSDSIPVGFENDLKRLEDNMPVPEIRSFNERVYLWYALFSVNEITNNQAEFTSRIRGELKNMFAQDLLFKKNTYTYKWNWKITNVSYRPKFRGTSKREKKDYMREILNPYTPPYEIYALYDWTVNNKNPYQRQQVRMNLMEFPKLYFFIQMLKFINVLEGFIREVPTHYQITEQLKVSYRSDKIVFTYTY